jgi:hypothetical protein
MRYNTMTAYVVAAFAAALMLSSALVFIPQAAYAPHPLKIEVYSILYPYIRDIPPIS